MPAFSDDDVAEVVFRGVPRLDALGYAGAGGRGSPHSRGGGGSPPAASARPKLATRLRRYRLLCRRHWRLLVVLVSALVFATQLLFILLFAAPLEAYRGVGAESGGGWAAEEQVLLKTLADRERGATGSLHAVATRRPRRWAGAASAAVSRAASTAAEDDGPVDPDVDEDEPAAAVTGLADSAAPLPSGTQRNTGSAPHMNTFTETRPTPSPPRPPQQQQQSSAPPETTGIVKPRTAVTAPVQPALWVQGGGSVRVPQAFTVLTVLTGPPMPASQLSASALAGNTGRGWPAQLLRRAAVGLVHAGVTRHPSFYEWLLVHNVVLDGPHRRAADEEAAAVRRWWAAAATMDQNQQQQQQQGRGEGEEPRVRVAGLAPTAAANPQMQKVAYALVHGVRLVLTEYVVLHDLRWTLPRDGIVASLAGYAGSAAPSPVERSSNSTVVQREITLGLQTLSKNGVTALPVMVIDDAQAGLAEDVHAYRLQAYATQDWRQPEKEAALQATLIDYVRRARSAETATATSPQPPTASAGVAHTGTEHASDAAAAGVSKARVQDGLPTAAYSASAHFHCQRAPLYAVRMPVPTWLRRSRPSTVSTTRTTRAASAARSFTTSKPALTTLCEALVSQQIGLGESFAVQGATFYRLFCQDWLQFTLLPSPKTPVRPPRPGEDAGAAGAGGGEGIGALLANLRGGGAAPKESDAEAQRMDMTQHLGDGLCAVQWLAHLKAAQMRYAELAERRRVGAHRSTKPVPASSSEHLALTNSAGRSPYLDQYAALLFSDNVTQLSRLAGTYLAFLPNVSYALGHVRDTMESKLEHVTLKHAVERNRRFLSVKQPTDREVVCVASHLARADRTATLYKTQWFLANLGLRCVQHKTSCLGSLNESDERSLQLMDAYFSTTGKWSRGEYRVCMSAGAYVSDPSSELS